MTEKEQEILDLYLKDLQKLNTYLNSFNLTSYKEQIEKEKNKKLSFKDNKRLK